MHSADEIRSASLANARIMIQENMRDSDKWLIRGLLAIYNYQTQEEKNIKSTKHNNGVGFSGIDGQIMTSFAQQVLRWLASSNRRFNTPLSQRQMEIARNKMQKYAMQLARISRSTASTASTASKTDSSIVPVKQSAQ